MLRDACGDPEMCDHARARAHPVHAVGAAENCHWVYVSMGPRLQGVSRAGRLGRKSTEFFFPLLCLF